MRKLRKRDAVKSVRAIRSERVRTYNYPQGRVTDHRINLTLYKLENIMNGDIDEFIQALAEARRAELMKEAEESND